MIGAASALGFATTLLAIITSMVPPAGSSNPTLFFIKVIGGSVLLIYSISRSKKTMSA